MINKVELVNIINKYYLNGLVESTKWDVKTNNLNIRFTSPTKEMIGEINHSNFDIQDSSIGISNTSQLLKLLGITSGDLLLSYIKNGKAFNKLIISDSQFTVNYALADTLTVAKTGTFSGVEEYNLETDLNLESITAIIKAKSALPESKNVVMKPTTSMDGQFELELIFGGDIEYANKVSYFMTGFTTKDLPYEFELNFDSDIFKEIMNVNKDAEKAKMFVNLEGLVKFEFETCSTKSTYYLVKRNM